MTTIAIANMKGGVAKSSTALNLAAALAAGGDTVLLVEVDPQGSIAPALGLGPVAPGRSMAEVLLDGADLESVEVPVPGYDTFRAAPATDRLAAALYSLPIRPDPWHWLLADALDGAAKRHRWIIIDTPPSMGTMTTLAFAAATMVIVPTQLETASWRNVGELYRAVELVRTQGGRRPLNPDLRVLGVLPTFVDLRSTFARQLLERMRRDPVIRVLEPPVKRQIVMHEATLAGRPILDYAPKSDAAMAYRALAQEVIRGAA